MKILLDTNVLLWALQDSPRIRPIRALLLNPEHDIAFSVASLWEIAIKSGLGKLAADAAEIRDVAKNDGFTELPILGPHILALASLPALHRDPFDRLLIAQARSEPMRLLTGDAKLAEYGELIDVV